MQVNVASEPAPGRAGEDYALATTDLVVVLDGAAPPVGADTGCVHGVRWYVRALGTLLANRLVSQPDSSLVAALEAAVDEVTAAHRHTCEPSHPCSPSCTVAAVRVRDGRLDWLVLADSVVLVERADGVAVVTDGRPAAAVQARRAALAGAATGSAAPRIRNVPGGYWVAADDPAAARESMTGSAPAAEVRCVVLLTDGASRPVDLFGQLTWEACTTLVRGCGPQALLSEVRRLERRDPDGRRWPRGKRHDDATVVLMVPDGRGDGAA